MDTVLLFALPLVGGLIFCSHCNCTRWRVAREDGHRLYFRAVLSGAIIFALVATVHIYATSSFKPYLEAIKWLKGFIEPWAKEKAAASATADLTIICFLSMLAGLPLAWLLNGAFWRPVWLRRAIRKDPLEAFLLDSRGQ